MKNSIDYLEEEHVVREDAERVEMSEVVDLTDLIDARD